MKTKILAVCFTIPFVCFSSLDLVPDVATQPRHGGKSGRYGLRSA